MHLINNATQYKLRSTSKAILSITFIYDSPKIQKYFCKLQFKNKYIYLPLLLLSCMLYIGKFIDANLTDPEKTILIE